VRIKTARWCPGVLVEGIEKTLIIFTSPDLSSHILKKVMNVDVSGVYLSLGGNDSLRTFC
jgi:hypothetical protein